MNSLTGLGILGKDKRLGSLFSPDLVSQETCELTWRGDDMFARMVETVPNEMLREPFEVAIEGDKELSEECDSLLRDLEVKERIRTALCFARAYGGAGILLGADDGARTLEAPLNEEGVRSLKWLTVFTPRELHPVRYFSDPLYPRYGDIEVYRLMPWYAPPGAPTTPMPLIHESRIVRFSGAETSRRARLTNVQPGWEDSLLVRVGQIVSDFQAAWQGASLILQDFAPPTLKMKGLAKILAGQSDSNALRNRAAAIEVARSMARTTIIDSEEEFKRETTTVTGLADLLEKLMLRLAAAAQMPVSLLFGQAPAGLNATGDADTRWFYDQVAATQERHLKPAAKRICKMMFLAKDGPTGGVEPENWDIRFPPLWQVDDTEVAKLRLAQAQADQLYIEAQAVTPEEIAKSRFGGESYSLETHIDVDLREKLAAPDHQEERLGGDIVGNAEQEKKNAEAAAKAPKVAPPGAKGAPPKPK